MCYAAAGLRVRRGDIGRRPIWSLLVPVPISPIAHDSHDLIGQFVTTLALWPPLANRLLLLQTYPPLAAARTVVDDNNPPSITDFYAATNTLVRSNYSRCPNWCTQLPVFRKHAEVRRHERALWTDERTVKACCSEVHT